MTSPSTVTAPASTTRTSAPTRPSRTGSRLSGADAGNYTLSSTRPRPRPTSRPRRSPAASPPTTRSTTATPTATVCGPIAAGRHLAATRSRSTAAPTPFDDQQRRHRQDRDADRRPLGGADAGNYSLGYDQRRRPRPTSPPSAITGSFTAERQGLRRHHRCHRHRPARSTASSAATPSRLTGGTATFDNRNVGAARTVTLHRCGAGRRRRRQLQPRPRSATTTADITPRARSSDSFTAANKVYDGTTAATITGRSLAGTVRRRRRQPHRWHAPPSTTRTSAPTRPSPGPASRSAAPTPATTRLDPSRTATADITPRRSPAASRRTTRSTTATPPPR